MDPDTAIAFYFDVDSKKETQINTANKFGLIQFKTTFTHPSGQRMLRCTTVAHNWVPRGTPPSTLLAGFDQEAAAALVARLIVYKSQTEDIDMLKYVQGGGRRKEAGRGRGC
jgi:protein transport protein SEC23